MKKKMKLNKAILIGCIIQLIKKEGNYVVIWFKNIRHQDLETLLKDLNKSKSTYTYKNEVKISLIKSGLKDVKKWH